MMRVISSPSISTTGFVTLIFVICGSHLSSTGTGRRAGGKIGAQRRRRSHGGLYSIAFLVTKAALRGTAAQTKGSLDGFATERAFVPEKSACAERASERGERGVERRARPHRG